MLRVNLRGLASGRHLPPPPLARERKGDACGLALSPTYLHLVSSLLSPSDTRYQHKSNVRPWAIATPPRKPNPPLRRSIFAPAPEPKTALGRHRILSPTAGIRVSPLQLGAMSIGAPARGRQLDVGEPRLTNAFGYSGEAWNGMMGTMSKEDSFKLLDEFVACGGNFIDTANNYQVRTRVPASPKF